MSAGAAGFFEREKKRRAERIALAFAEHRATLETFVSPGGATMELVTWRRPRTGVYLVRYLADGHRLIVTGDLGAAVFAVSLRQDLGFWARCHADYFAGKCIASEAGPRFREWDGARAREVIRQLLQERPDRVRRFTELGGWQEAENRMAWAIWLGAYGHEVFGDDWWERGELGFVTAERCEMMLVGLQLALAQLAQERTAPAAAEQLAAGAAP